MARCCVWFTAFCRLPIRLRCGRLFCRFLLRLHVLAQTQPAHRFALLAQDVLHVALAIQVGEPVQIVGDQMVVVAAVAAHNHHAFRVRQRRDGFGVARPADGAREDQLQLALGDGSQRLALAQLVVIAGLLAAVEAAQRR